MAFDPALFIALGAGFLVGRLSGWHSPWIGRGAWATVILLVFLLGASLAAVPPGTLVATLPAALALAATLVGATLFGFLLIRPRRTPVPRATSPRPPRVVPVPLLLGSLAAGYFTLGRLDATPSVAIEITLYALLFLVALDLTLTRSALRQVGRPLAAAAIGAALATVVSVVVFRIALIPSLATTLAFGWYGLAGPLVGAQLGPTLGLLAFLANFLREDLTMLLARPIGRHFPGGAVAAVGGATSMDTTLAFSVASDPPDGATFGLGTGIVLTILASLIVPGVLALGRA